MIARDELAARCLVALLSNAGRVGHGSNVVDAVTCADALIARLASRPLAALSPALVPAATVPTPAYPVDAAGRPLWVRFTGKWAINSVTPRKVESWPTDSTPRVRSLVDPQRLITLPPDEWEPCAAPAETPAAALTEEEREELADKIREDRWQMSWDDIGAAARAYWLDRADAAAAWFAKRGGAK